MRLLLLLLGLHLLSGCSLLPTTPAPVVRPAQPDIASFTLNGRIAIRHNGVQHSAGLRWVHQPQFDELLLLAPLGQTAARIYRDVSGALLEDGAKRYQADDVESLMQQVLGWHLPLSGLHHWVLALPIAGSEAHIERDAEGRITLLHQDGWEVRYLRYAGDGADSLPTRLELSRDALRVQLLIDEWEMP
ncbi:MAG TPA: lipoprotein insertase outer membrane protein LolB [Gallionella sp.]|jgi:outer membrane lipoprotein LolB|nr:lipoprotein insertase outer membrane protein LolB [Gallionella sp.]